MVQLQDRVDKIIEKYEKKTLLGLVHISPAEFNNLANDFREMIQHPSRFKIQEKRHLTTMTLIGLICIIFRVKGSGKSWLRISRLIK